MTHLRINLKTVSVTVLTSCRLVGSPSVDVQQLLPASLLTLLYEVALQLDAVSL